MSTFNPQGDSENPYKSYDESGRLPSYNPTAAGIDSTVIRKFRNEIHALGGFWIFIALVVIVAAAAAFYGAFGQLNSEDGTLAIFGGVLLGLGALWLLIGVAACMKHMWAVYVGLGLSYLSLVGNLLRLNVCGIIILAIVIFQAHRVINWARDMRRAGIPLTAKP